LGHSTSAVASGGRTVFSRGNLSTDPDEKTMVDGTWLSDLCVLHTSLGCRTTSAAPCDTGACRQVALCTRFQRGLVGRSSMKTLSLCDCRDDEQSCSLVAKSWSSLNDRNRRVSSADGVCMV